MTARQRRRRVLSREVEHRGNTGLQQTLGIAPVPNVSHPKLTGKDFSHRLSYGLGPIRSLPTHGRSTSGIENRAVGLLIVFQDGDQRAADGDGGAVERVDEVRALLALDAGSGCSAAGPGSRCSCWCW